MFECGCDPSYEGGYGDDGQSYRYSMEWCALHAAAPELLQACEAALARFRDDRVGGYHEFHPVTLLERAIDHAQGKEERGEPIKVCSQCHRQWALHTEAGTYCHEENKGSANEDHDPLSNAPFDHAQGES